MSRIIESEITRFAEQKKREEQRKRDDARITRVNEMLTDCDGWHVVQAAPQKELLVERLLSQLGFPVFVPIVYRWRRVNSRHKVRRFVPYVMASRYVFVGRYNTIPFPWHRLLEFGLVHRPLMLDGRALEIPKLTMQGLFETSREANDRRSAVRLNKSVAPGDVVTILHGPFAGHEVVIQGIEKKKARVIIELFAKAQTVSLDLGDVEAV